LIFENKRIALILELFSQVALFVLYPHQGKVVAFFSLPANQAYLELWVELRGMFALLILLSQKQDLSRNKSYNLIKRYKCVEYFLWIVIYLSPLFIFGHGY
jgi:hypothetical protein